MSFKDVYSEVKARKMAALGKKDVVQAVEKHGKILAVSGKFEKPKKVIQHMYAAEKRVIRPADVMKTDLNQYDVLLIGCPGSEIPSGAYPKIKDFVVGHGGWLLTTDWAIRSIVEYNFPGFIRWNEKRTDDVVVSCQIMEPNHPFLDGLLGEITQSKWQKETVKGTKKDEFRWWLENRSFPIEILSDSVHVLIASWEIKDKWGEAPVLVYFDYGQAGGRVIHMISHTHLQKGGKKGKFASALIMTNILDEKVSEKMGIGKKPASGYTSDWESQGSQAPQDQQYVTPHYAQQSGQKPLEEQWVSPPEQGTPQQSNFVTPTMGGGGGGLTGTSQIIEADVNSATFSFATKCEYCSYDFGEAVGKIFQCKECGAMYHENCVNLQVNEGVCKKCNRILLW